MELSLRHALIEKKNEYEAYMKAQKDKEKDFKSYKKAEIQMKSAQDSFSNLKLANEKVLSKVRIDIYLSSLICLYLSAYRKNKCRLTMAH